MLDKLELSSTSTSSVAEGDAHKTLRRCRLMAWVGASILLATALCAEEDLRELEAKLEATAGAARLPLLVSLAESYAEEQPSQAIELATEGLGHLEAVPDEAAELNLHGTLAAAYTASDAYTDALSHAAAAERLARRAGDESQLAAVLSQLATIRRRLQQYRAAIAVADEAAELYSRLGDTAARAEATRSAGNACFGLADYTSALRYYLEAKELFDQAGDSSEAAGTLNNIGVIYSKLGQYDDALEIYRQSLALVRSSDDPDSLASLLNNIGLVHQRSGTPERAVDYFRQAIETSRGLDDERSLSYYYNNLGMSLEELGQLDEAMSYLERSLAIKERLGDRRAAIDTLFNIAQIHGRRGQPGRALELVLIARDSALEIGAKMELETSWEHLAELYAEAGRYREAFEASQQRLEVSSELFNERNSELIAEMKARYESQQQEEQIHVLEQQQRIDALEIERQQTLSRALGLGSGLVLLLTLGTGYLLWQRKTVERERAVSGRLRKLDKLKDEFLAKTSHELRTPLHGITGLAESLIDGARGQLAPELQGDLSMIVASGRRLGHLVDDILDFSKLRHKRLELQFRALDLRALTDVVLALCAPLAASKTLELRNAVAPDLPLVEADENRLQQILHNLIGNAIKFTDAGIVQVSAAVVGDHLSVSVADTGIGIPEDRQESIFQVFEQADASTKRDFGGTGLGLAVTRRLVELHGGKIRVESTPSKGSIFTFELAIAGEEVAAGEIPEVVAPSSAWPGLVAPIESAATPASGMSPAVDSSRARLLLVDDEPVNLQVLCNYLTAQGFELTLATSGDQALELLREQSFDLVLLDVMMPRVSGYDVCRALRETHPLEELPVIFLTAKNRASDVVAGLSIGANDFLTKPISKDELLARVRPHLELLSIHRHLEELVEEKVSQVKVLQGLLPICAACKKIREDDGYWSELEVFIDRHSEARFTHGLCPDCVKGYEQQQIVEKLV